MVIVVWIIGELPNIATCQASQTKAFKNMHILWPAYFVLKTGMGESIRIGERESKRREGNGYDSLYIP